MPHDLIALCKYRFELGKDSLESAKTLLKKKDLRGSLNRSYYSIFYSARALLALKQLETKKHSGLVATFIKEYVASGIFDKEVKKYLETQLNISVD
jgi:uncharacterized protein (UPF0332 family)